MSKPETNKLIKHKGFDLHYTPGGEPIVGLKAVKNMLNNYEKNNIAESATLLANTIYASRNIEDVTWQTSFGGSAILTQALTILRNQNKSNFKGHSIYLYHPTSNSKLVKQLAKDLEFDSVDMSTCYTSFKELRGNHIPNLSSKKNLLSVGDNGLTTASTAASLLGVVGIAFSPLIGVAAAGIAVGKAVLHIKNKHVSTTYKKR